MGEFVMTKIQVDSNGKAITLGGKVLEAVGYLPVISSLNVTPTTSAQTITASSSTDGYSPINVSAVTSSIDSNITAGNIKKDVTILGVTGTYEGSGGGGIGIPREVSATGVYQMPAESFTFSLPSNATDLDTYALSNVFRDCSSLTSVDLSSLTTISSSGGMYYAFYGCTNLTSIDLSSLITISGGNGMYNAFYNCSKLTSVNLPSLTIISSGNGMSYTFSNCSKLTSIDLSSLTTISGNSGMYYAFSSCPNLTSVDLSNLTTISGNSALSYAFFNCSNLTSVDLSNLTTISGNTALSNAFYRCSSLTSLSFPALTSTSFGSYKSQFNSMLFQVTGCTVHFPSNLQSVIGSWSSVTSGFGGTNTTVLFDLPATT